jgi:RNA-directed DNA polymerase
MANGPAGVTVEWAAVDWQAHEGNVRRLRQRIFKAAQEQDWARVRSLQKMMLRSWSNTLVSVRQVAQRNAGRVTPGVDGQVALSSQARGDLAVRVHQTITSWRPRVVRRVFIPKPGGKQRPLGIPVLMDRCHQARVRNALEPEWEARFEPRSYGFRPGRGCADAIGMLYIALKGKNKREWILDADLRAAFDRIDHDRLTALLGAFPARDMIRAWLRSGVMENGQVTPTEEGTPQGGVISPLLLNIALHGLEEAAGVRYRGGRSHHAGETLPRSAILVRYADDLVVCCHSRQQAEQVQARIADWLRPRGLALNEDKTQIVHLSQGFDFLGFNVRRYGAKLLIKPSPEAIGRLRKRLAAEMRALRGSNATAVIATLNPIIRGWAAYYRGVVSSRTFSALDTYLWRLTYKWAKISHRNKSKKWVTARYFGKFNKFRNDHWVFGDRDSGAHLTRFSWTPIVRHQIVQGRASPDDPALADYWAARRRRVKPPLDGYTLRLLDRQQGRCPLCGEHLLSAEQPPDSPSQWHRWWQSVVRKAISSDYLTHDAETGGTDGNPLRLVHTHCNRTQRARHHQTPAHHSCPPSRLA